MQFPTRVSAALLLSFLALGTIATAQNQYVILYPGANSDQTILQVYQSGSGTLFSKATPINTLPRGTSQIIPMPDGSKYYVIANGVPVSTMDPSFSIITQIAGSISVAPTTAALTPDGRKLIVAAGNNIFVIDTSTDAVIAPQGLALGGKIVDLAVNLDSTKAFALVQSPISSSSGTILSAIDLTIATPSVVGTSLTLPGDLANPATGITIAPSGLLYLANNYRVFEINPVTLTVTPNGEIPVEGYPGKPYITPDNKYLVAANLRPTQRNTLFMQVNLTTKATSSFPNINDVISQFFNQAPDSKGNNRLYASTVGGQLYDLTLGSGPAPTGTLLLPIATASAVNNYFPNAYTFNGIQFSNENPPKLMWGNYGGNGTPSYIVQADLQLQNSTQIPAPTANLKLGTLSINPSSGGTALLPFNNNQQVQPGKQTALPIIAQLVDPLGRGIFRGQISFTSATPNVMIATPTFVTGSSGYGQTYVTAPNTPGATFTVTANGGPGVTPVDFTFTIPGTGTGGGGGGNTLGGLFYVAGNGQIVRESFQMAVPMQVLALDALGKPLPNAGITWTTDVGYGSYMVQNQTDKNGIAQLLLTGRTDVSFSNSPTQPTKVTATDTLGNIVTFIFTTTAARLPDNTDFPSPTVVEYAGLDENGNPIPQFPKGRVITAAAGSIVKGAYFARIVLTAGASVGQGIQNIGVCFTNTDPEGRDETPGPVPAGSTTCGVLPSTPGPTADCVGAPVSDAGGLVICDLKIGKTLGSIAIYPRIGEVKTLQPIKLTVTAGPPSVITSFSGDKQSGKAGAALPIPFGVRVTDLAGNALSGVPIAWTQILGTGAKLVPNTSTTNINGQASINVTLPTVSGPLKIQATVSKTLFVQFDANVDSQVGSVSVVTGDNQSAFVGQPFTNPLVVVVKDQQGIPLPNTQVTFSSFGPGTINPTSAVTGADGTASTRVTAGPLPGVVSVTAIVGTFSTAFNKLMVSVPGPQITVSSFLNAATGLPGLAPCGLGIIQGTGIATGVVGTTVPGGGLGPNPTSIPPVQSVIIGGIAAPLTSVSNIGGVERVGFQIPCEVPVGTTTATVTIINGGSTPVSGIPVSTVSPGLFESFQSEFGQTYAVAQHITTGAPITPANPAVPGETIRVFFTGAGQTTPGISTNIPGFGGQTINAQVIANVQDVGVTVVKAEYSANLLGYYFVDILLPTSVETGQYQKITVQVQATPDSPAISSNAVYIPIQ